MHDGYRIHTRIGVEPHDVVLKVRTMT